MPITPWYTSQDLVAAVQRKIAIPLNQRTFTSDDVLAFCNEEMVIQQVPDILMYHQEYFVWSEDVPMVAYQTHYPVPERAMGMKLRDVFYVDTNGNLFEITRIEADDKAYWQRESGSGGLTQKYYLEGNDIVLAPQSVPSPTGSLRFSYFLRPNSLVDNTRAAIISSYFTNILVTKANIAPGDTLSLSTTLKFTAVSGSPGANQFQIGSSDAITAQNLANAIVSEGTYTATITTPNIVSLIYKNIKNLYFYSSNVAVPQLQTYIMSSNISGINPLFQIGMNISGVVPSNITINTLVDLLQTKSGHRLYNKDVQPLAVSTSAITFNANDVPIIMSVGDYICQQYECIIPQIPTDLHNGLAERAAARILAAQGDAQGLQISNAKIADIKKSEGILSENRVEGSSQKVNLRKSTLSFQRMGTRRRI